MQKILLFSLLALSLFPACKRHSEHTQNGAVSTTCHDKCQKRAKTFPDDTCELVDRSNLGKGVACLAGAPVVLGAGVGLGSLVIVGPGCCVPGVSAILVATGLVAGGLVGTITLLCKGCSYLSQHARANKERERCAIAQKNREKRAISV